MPQMNLFREDQHPRGQPENSGEFRGKGQSAKKPAGPPPLVSMLPNGIPIRFEQNHYRTRGDITVMVPVAAIEAGWQKGLPGMYIGPDNPGIENRREGVAKYLSTGKPVEAPKILVDRRGAVLFQDGRHRFAVLRDSGLKEIAVTVNAKELQLLQMAMDRSAEREAYSAGLQRSFGFGWREDQHPRGQPENAGEFAPKHGGEATGAAPPAKPQPAPVSQTGLIGAPIGQAGLEQRIDHNGVVWMRAPRYGATSKVTGRFYAGGTWMPITGARAKRAVDENQKTLFGDQQPEPRTVQSTAEHSGASQQRSLFGAMPEPTPVSSQQRSYTGGGVQKTLLDSLQQAIDRVSASSTASPPGGSPPRRPTLAPKQSSEMVARPAPANVQPAARQQSGSPQPAQVEATQQSPAVAAPQKPASVAAPRGQLFPTLKIAPEKVNQFDIRRATGRQATAYRWMHGKLTSAGNEVTPTMRRDGNIVLKTSGPAGEYLLTIGKRGEINPYDQRETEQYTLIPQSGAQAPQGESHWITAHGHPVMVGGPEQGGGGSGGGHMPGSPPPGGSMSTEHRPQQFGPGAPKPWLPQHTGNRLYMPTAGHDPANSYRIQGQGQGQSPPSYHLLPARAPTGSKFSQNVMSKTPTMGASPQQWLVTARGVVHGLRRSAATDEAGRFEDHNRFEAIAQHLEGAKGMRPAAPSVSQVSFDVGHPDDHKRMTLHLSEAFGRWLKAPKYTPEKIEDREVTGNETRLQLPATTREIRDVAKGKTFERQLAKEQKDAEKAKKAAERQAQKATRMPAPAAEAAPTGGQKTFQVSGEAQAGDAAELARRLGTTGFVGQPKPMQIPSAVNNRRVRTAIEQLTKDYGMSVDEIMPFVEAEHEAFQSHARDREAAKARLRQLTGLSAADARVIENSGHDYSSAHKILGANGQPRFPAMARWDEYVQELAREFGHLGIKESTEGGSDEVWSMLREGAGRALQPHDPDIIRAAADRAWDHREAARKANINFSEHTREPGDEEDDSIPESSADFDEHVPFARFGSRARYSLPPWGRDLIQRIHQLSAARCSR